MQFYWFTHAGENRMHYLLKDGLLMWAEFVQIWTVSCGSTSGWAGNN